MKLLAFRMSGRSRKEATASHPPAGTAGLQQKPVRLTRRSLRKPVADLGRMRRAPGTRRLAGLLASLFLFLVCAPTAASVDYGDGQTQGYSFDPMGNRLTKSDSIAGNDTYSYNAANMLLARNGGSYTNDANGNTLTGGGRTNSWDGQNRLTQCVYNGNTSTFTYGSDGLRRRSVENGVTTDHVLDGQGVVREMRGANVHATYFHGLRGPEYRRDSGNNVKWYLYDGLGSVLGELDANGYITASRKLDVYGAVRSSAGTSTSRHKFVGGLGHPSEDESGYIYMRARYYDPVTGRFASEDPAKDGGNWFLYADNSPTNSVDPTGQVSLPSWILVMLDQALSMAGVTPPGYLTSLTGLAKQALLTKLEELCKRTDEGWDAVTEGEYKKVIGKGIGGPAGQALVTEGTLQQKRGLRQIMGFVLLRKAIDIIRNL